jgi:hypothetical protein
VLLEAARSAGLDINVENGVGDTPLEIAQTQYWLATTRSLKRPSANLLQLNTAVSVRVDAADWERRLAALRRATAELVQSGRLQEGTPLHGAITSFIGRIERKLAMKEIESECTQKEDSRAGDTASRAQTLAVVRAAYEVARPARRLVHLADVQRAVRRRLDENARIQEEKRANEYNSERQAGLETKPAKRVVAPWKGFTELM